MRAFVGEWVLSFMSMFCREETYAITFYGFFSFHFFLFHYKLWLEFVLLGCKKSTYSIKLCKKWPLIALLMFCSKRKGYFFSFSGYRCICVIIIFLESLAFREMEWWGVDNEIERGMGWSMSSLQSFVTHFFNPFWTFSFSFFVFLFSLSHPFAFG